MEASSVEGELYSRSAKRTIMDSKKKKKEAPDRYSGIRALYEVEGKDGPKTKPVGKGRG